MGITHLSRRKFSAHLGNGILMLTMKSSDACITPDFITGLSQRMFYFFNYKLKVFKDCKAF